LVPASVTIRASGRRGFVETEFVSASFCPARRAAEMSLACTIG
jgi:hypothetical protein